MASVGTSYAVDGFDMALSILVDGIAAPDSHGGFDPVIQLGGLKTKRYIAQGTVEERFDGLVYRKGRDHGRGDVENECPDVDYWDLVAKMGTICRFAREMRAEEGGLGPDVGDER